MKTFIYILAMAVASCKAGFEGGFSESQDTKGSPGQYDFSVQTNHIQGGQEEHNAPANFHFSAPAENHNYGNHDSLSGISFDPQNHGSGAISSFGPQNHGHTDAIAHSFSGSHGHDFSSPLLQHFNQFQGYNAPQAKGFDLGGFGGHSDGSFGASGHGFQGDSYLQAAHDLGLGQEHFTGYNEAQGNSEEQKNYNDNQNHDNAENQHERGANLGPHEFILHDGGEEFGHVDDQNSFYDGGDYQAQAIPVGEHTDVESPVSVPDYKHVTVAIPKPVHVQVPKPILVGVPHPYPVKVPVHKPVAVPVETEISIPIQKVVPYPVVKHIPYPVEKHVPYKVEKTVTVHVPQPYPVKIPVYKTIHHHKGH